MELKDLLKQIKMNESKLSTVLGLVVIAIIGVMVFNYFRNIQTGTTTPTAVVSENNTQDKKYTVKAGDSLSSIAREFYGNPNKWTDIADANSLEDSNNLEVGQELTIPADTIATPTTIAQATSAATIKPSATPTETIKPTVSPIPAVDDKENSDTTTYTVAKGDSLWSIAVEVYGDGNQWSKISKANNLKNPNIIHSGNVFTIPR